MDLFEYVKGLTRGDRRRDYDHPLPNHLRIAIIWSVQKGIVFNPVEVAFMLGSGLKSARQAKTNKFDNVVDTAGYMDCVNEMVNLLNELNNHSDFCNPVLTEEENRTNAIVFLSGLSVGEQWDLLQECESYFEEVVEKQKSVLAYNVLT